MRMEEIDGGTSRFNYSYDRGHTWKGPYRLPDFGAPGTAARTEYIVNGPHDMHIFITAAKENGGEGRPLCARTTDGGTTWEKLGWIGPEPRGFSIMPAAVRLSGQEILTAVRRRRGPDRWIESWRTQDNGHTWFQDNEILADTGIGNPPSLIKLQDGRLCLTYGVREEPFRICAKLSNDNGHTWSDEIVLRDDGCSRDVGYVRSTQRPDGNIVTIYYFCTEDLGPERYIAATIWKPIAP